MTPEETAIILDQLAVAWDKVLEPELLPIWAHQLSGVDPSVALAASRALIRDSIYFPKLAEMNMAIAEEIRDRAKAAETAKVMGSGPDRDCPTCHGKGWYETDPIALAATGTGEIQVHYEQHRPCQFCNPVGYDRWLAYKVERKAQSRYRGTDTELDSNHSALQQARDLLAQGEA